MSITTYLDKLKAIEDAATPGPWFYDMGNHEVESKNKDHYRFSICPISPLDRKTELGENAYLAEKEPVDYGYLINGYSKEEIHRAKKHPYKAMEDAEFIATSRTALPLLIAALEKAIAVLSLRSEQWAKEALEDIEKMVEGK